MEKNKKEKTTISIGEVVAIIVILLLAIVTLGGMIYQKNKNKYEEEELEKQIITLEKQVEELNNQIQEIDDDKENVNNSNVEKKEKYSYSDVKGQYKCEIDLTEDWTANYRLRLYENGTFVYDHSITSHDQSVGNYIINGDIIILNELIRVGGDISSRAVTGREIKLKINSDGSISDTNKLIDATDFDNNIDVDLSNIKLEKDLNFELNENEVIETLKYYQDYVYELENKQ